MTRAERPRRVFQIDVTTCPECGGRLRWMADVVQPTAIRKILLHLQSRAPPASQPGASPSRRHQDDRTATLASPRSCGLFFLSSFPLLESYVRHVAAAAVLDQQLDAFEPASLADDRGLARYATLLAARERQSRALIALARSMRLTQQAQVHPVTAGRAQADNVPPGPKLWDR